MAWSKLVSQQFLVIFYGISYVYTEDIHESQNSGYKPSTYKPPSPMVIGASTLTQNNTSDYKPSWI